MKFIVSVCPADRKGLFIMFQSLGFKSTHAQQLETLSESLGMALRPARVQAEHRGAYELIASDGMIRASISGRLRHTHWQPEQLPTVGDWVCIDSSNRIEAVLARTSVLTRRAAGSESQAQVIVANIDLVLIVTSANRDFNPRRIERLVAAVIDGGAQPVLVLNKIDLCENADALLEQLDGTCRKLPVARISALEQEGQQHLSRFIAPGKTIALVGSSGVGKSTLANWLLGTQQLDTGAVRRTDDHGKHTTTGRALFVIPGGGVLIDTPGMREFGLWLANGEQVGGFEDIDVLMGQCRFQNCQHHNQPDCAVQLALQEDRLSQARWDNYGKLQREVAYQQKAGSYALDQQYRKLGKQHAAKARQRKRSSIPQKF